jgi:hypothetical protein
MQYRVGCLNCDKIGIWTIWGSNPGRGYLFRCFRISSSSLAGHQLILGLFSSLRMSTVVSGEM